MPRPDTVGKSFPHSPPQARMVQLGGWVYRKSKLFTDIRPCRRRRRGSASP